MYIQIIDQVSDDLDSINEDNLDIILRNLLDVVKKFLKK